MEQTTLWAFAQGLWHEVPLRRALFRFQAQFQQSACLLIALCWLAASQRLPDMALLKRLREQTDASEQRLAPLRRLVQGTASAAEEAAWHQALLKAQLEGEKVLLAQLQALIDAVNPPAGQVLLDTLVLQVLPEIGFCEGQTQLLAELIRTWEGRQA